MRRFCALLCRADCREATSTTACRRRGIKSGCSRFSRCWAKTTKRTWARHGNRVRLSPTVSPIPGSNAVGHLSPLSTSELIYPVVLEALRKAETGVDAAYGEPACNDTGCVWLDAMLMAESSCARASNDCCDQRCCTRPSRPSRRFTQTRHWWKLQPSPSHGSSSPATPTSSTSASLRWLPLSRYRLRRRRARAGTGQSVLAHSHDGASHDPTPSRPGGAIACGAAPNGRHRLLGEPR